MLLGITIILLGGVAAVVAYFCNDLARVADQYDREWILRWAGWGVLAPLIAWGVLNIGQYPLLPPLTAGIAAAQHSGHAVWAFVGQMSVASLAIGSFWAMLTCGWFAAALFHVARNRDDLIISTVVWSPLAIPVFWLLLYFVGWSAFGWAALIWLCPLTQYLLINVEIYKPSPHYSQAIAKMKFGRYGDAEITIIGQLEKCESDFDGWMMLADLYARHFHDMRSAEQTIVDVCADPSITVSQVSIALHRLADWQIEFNKDPEAARQVLEEICSRMPGTHLATMAAHRISQLPKSAAELEESQKQRTYQMPSPIPTPIAPVETGPELSMEQAIAKANELVESLNVNPKDIAAREKLARLCESPLGKIDMALEQLSELASMNDAPPGKAVEWLNQMATWEIKHRGEGEGAQKILLRLIHEHPQSPQAFAAQKKLIFMQRTKGPRQKRDEES